MFREVARAGSWEDIQESLENPAFIAAENNGHISEGDYRLIEENPGIEGLYIDSEIIPSNEEVPREERASGGFHFRNSDGSPMEIKYRFPHELREYPEKIHVHNVPELYFPTGEFNMEVASAETEDGFTNITFDQPLEVPAGMYHGITSREEGAGLIIARGDPQLQQETVGKWDINGEQLYDHAKHLQFPELTFYEESRDEMYSMQQ